MKRMRLKFLQSMILGAAAFCVMLGWATGPLQAQDTPPPPASVAAPTDNVLGNDDIEPGYRTVDAATGLAFNPFEPINDVRTDTNSELAQAMLKRIKGYVVQPNGSPLLVIDGKSYRIHDKVPMTAAAKTVDKKASKKDAPVAVAAAVGGDTVTILNITPTEAVFQKDDASGFGGETFKIFFNFKHETDDTGKTNYNVWEPAGNGFFINEDGVIAAPLDIAQGGELSVMTPYGYAKATLVESDSKRGIGLLKVNVKSLPLYIADKKPELADSVFPVGYPLDQKVGLRFLEGFVKEANAGLLKLSPEVDGTLVGGVILNREAEVVGMLVGQTGMINSVVVLNPSDSIFRKYTPSKEPADNHVPSRSTIEQSVVRIFKKK